VPPHVTTQVREAKKRYERNTRITAELASRAALLESRAYGAWVSAREKAEWVAYAPILAEMLALQKEMLRQAL